MVRRAGSILEGQKGPENVDSSFLFQSLEDMGGIDSEFNTPAGCDIEGCPTLEKQVAVAGLGVLVCKPLEAYQVVSAESSYVAPLDQQVRDYGVGKMVVRGLSHSNRT
jgi:hypothetical protein